MFTLICNFLLYFINKTFYLKAMRCRTLGPNFSSTLLHQGGVCNSVAGNKLCLVYINKRQWNVSEKWKRTTSWGSKVKGSLSFVFQDLRNTLRGFSSKLTRTSIWSHRRTIRIWVWTNMHVNWNRFVQACNHNALFIYFDLVFVYDSFKSFMLNWTCVYSLGHYQSIMLCEFLLGRARGRVGGVGHPANGWQGKIEVETEIVFLFYHHAEKKGTCPWSSRRKKHHSWADLPFHSRIFHFPQRCEHRLLCGCSDCILTITAPVLCMKANYQSVLWHQAHRENYDNSDIFIFHCLPPIIHLSSSSKRLYFSACCCFCHLTVVWIIQQSWNFQPPPPLW